MPFSSKMELIFGHPHFLGNHSAPTQMCFFIKTHFFHMNQTYKNVVKMLRKTLPLRSTKTYFLELFEQKI